MRNARAASVAVVVPVTGVALERLPRTCPSPARPTRWPPSCSSARAACATRLPRTSRGMSSRHAGASSSASSSGWRWQSAEIINHHSASVFSVEKPIVVPWKFRRERRICSASCMRSSRLGSFGWRFSIEVPVDHRRRRPQVRLDRDAVEPLGVERVLAARQRFERGDLADRQVGGLQRRVAHDAAFDEADQRLLDAARRVLPESPSPLRRRRTACTRSASRRRRAGTASTSAGRRGRGSRDAAHQARPIAWRSRKPDRDRRALLEAGVRVVAAGIRAPREARRRASPACARRRRRGRESRRRVARTVIDCGAASCRIVA